MSGPHTDRIDYLVWMRSIFHVSRSRRRFTELNYFVEPNLQPQI